MKQTTKQVLTNVSLATIFMGVVFLVSMLAWWFGNSKTGYRKGFSDATKIYTQNIQDYDHTVLRLKEEIVILEAARICR